MLPDLRQLITFTLLSVSVLVFGFGAAALLRSAHDDFSGLQFWRAGREPGLTRNAENTGPLLPAPRDPLSLASVQIAPEAIPNAPAMAAPVAVAPSSDQARENATVATKQDVAKSGTLQDNFLRATDAQESAALPGAPGAVSTPATDGQPQPEPAPTAQVAAVKSSDGTFTEKPTAAEPIAANVGTAPTASPAMDAPRDEAARQPEPAMNAPAAGAAAEPFSATSQAAPESSNAPTAAAADSAEKAASAETNVTLAAKSEGPAPLSRNIASAPAIVTARPKRPAMRRATIRKRAVRRAPRIVRPQQQPQSPAQTQTTFRDPFTALFGDGR